MLLTLQFSMESKYRDVSPLTNNIKEIVLPDRRDFNVRLCPLTR